MLFSNGSGFSTRKVVATLGIVTMTKKIILFPISLARLITLRLFFCDRTYENERSNKLICAQNSSVRLIVSPVRGVYNVKSD